MLHSLVDPLRLLAVLPLRATRYGALLVARGAHRGERWVELALTDPALLRGWTGVPGAGFPPVSSRRLRDVVVDVRQEPATSVAVPEGRSGADDVLTDDALADWAQMPYAAASARAAELEPGALQALLDYERDHGHRPRFEQLLRHRLDSAAR